MGSTSQLWSGFATERRKKRPGRVDRDQNRGACPEEVRVKRLDLMSDSSVLVVLHEAVQSSNENSFCVCCVSGLEARPDHQRAAAAN